MCIYDAFINFVDYKDLDKLRQLYLSFEELAELKRYGNNNVILVYLELKESLEDLESKEEKNAIIHCLVEGYTYREYCEISGFSIGYISRLINSGLKNISIRLIRG